MSGALDGQAGVVTGGARGIGLAVAGALTVAGARVAIVDADGEAADAAARTVGQGAIGLTADVTDDGAIAAAFATVVDTFDRFDFLVNNAGVRHVAPIVEDDAAVWRRTVEVNLVGTFVCTQAAARLMLPRGGGAIVNLASMAGMLALCDRSAYNASKAGIIALTKSTAVELAGQGIRCNALAPGVIETELSAHYFGDPRMREVLETGTPQGRWGQVDDVAGPAVFLCSAAAKHIHGATLSVDGGWVAGKGY